VNPPMRFAEPQGLLQRHPILLTPTRPVKDAARRNGAMREMVEIRPAARKPSGHGTYQGPGCPQGTGIWGSVSNATLST
jgi:hypothetical protein